jgi:hypothetical protein
MYSLVKETPQESIMLPPVETKYQHNLSMKFKMPVRYGAAV